MKEGYNLKELTKTETIQYLKSLGTTAVKNISSAVIQQKMLSAVAIAIKCVQETSLDVFKDEEGK